MLNYPDDRVLSYGVPEVASMLKDWLQGQPASKRRAYKEIVYDLCQHATKTNCPQCNGHSISLSKFQKVMNGHDISERPLRDAFLHSVEACYGFRPTVPPSLSGEIMPSPWSCEEHAAEFDSVFNTSITGAHNLIGWAPFLPCSLETPEFIQAHHAALFRNYSDEVQKECVDLYDRIGLRHHQQFKESQGRAWTFWHLMRKEDVEAIAGGGKEYRYIRATLRRQCLTNLLSKISEPEWKVKLVIGDEIPPKVAAFFAGLDNIVCIDDRLVFRRDSFRTLTYNRDPLRVRQFKECLEAFVGEARFQGASAKQLLEDLIRCIPEDN